MNEVGEYIVIGFGILGLAGLGVLVLAIIVNLIPRKPRVHEEVVGPFGSVQKYQ
jgi:membrane-bound ClpP family serine protease